MISQALRALARNRLETIKREVGQLNDNLVTENSKIDSIVNIKDSLKERKQTLLTERQELLEDIQGA